MSRLNDFIVNITLATVPERSAPFGKILIVTDDVDQAYKEYANLTAVLVDFADSTAETNGLTFASSHEVHA